MLGKGIKLQPLARERVGKGSEFLSSLSFLLYFFWLSSIVSHLMVLVVKTNYLDFLR